MTHQYRTERGETFHVLATSERDTTPLVADPMRYYHFGKPAPAGYEYRTYHHICQGCWSGYPHTTAQHDAIVAEFPGKAAQP
jgi:hypothetical protein